MEEVGLLQDLDAAIKSGSKRADQFGDEIARSILAHARIRPTIIIAELIAQVLRHSCHFGALRTSCEASICR
jgi:predicted anti-sigma-YlaC factor YlaD